MIKDIANLEEMLVFGRALGAQLTGGEVIELVGDIGAGKTTLTKGIADGIGVDEDVQSPSFTLSRLYDGRDTLQLAHYDFYRLSDPGILADELAEVINDPQTVVVVEWADVVEQVLPAGRITIRITSPTETTRQLTITPDDIVGVE